MKRASRFAVSPNWKVLFNDMELDTNEILMHAQLPADLFNLESATLSSKEYFQLWGGIDKAAGNRQVPLLIARVLSVESFDVPIFAALCSANLNCAVLRISQYKPLIGPMDLAVTIKDEYTQLIVTCYGYEEPLPRSLSLTEMVFFTQLSRLATRQHIEPISVELPELPINIAEYEEFFGCQLVLGGKTAIRFTATDAKAPFLTKNTPMWSYFETKLDQKLADLETAATIVDRVKAVLLETLPAGESTIEHVAEKLAMSKRTLQRKLTIETHNYQAVLQAVRHNLAQHYLKNSKLSLGEISFLLGFQESNSFVRAYSTWTGSPPGAYRETCII
ncbi:MAG: AraC family transcriptional regulator ligand-binding domain-containing protein [Oceanospirillaceae bacterium]|nr:AraC family transcriptional regulator ligand-binding domain-containing protein [Oceanospirillaceae bacterium]